MKKSSSKFQINRRMTVAFALAIAGTTAMPLLADTAYPNKPIRLIVPYAPGGATDVIGRVLAKHLTEALGQPVLVDNRAGAGGSVGAGQVAKSAPDGYTLLLGAFTSHTINQALTPKVVPFDVNKSFSLISIAGTVPLVFVVNPNVPAKNLKELIALAKSKPGKLTFGSAGVGSPQHLSVEMFKRQAQVDVLHVPYKGSGPAVADLLGGQIDAMIDTVPAAQAQIKANSLRGLATTTAQRVSALPDIPTTVESGLPDFEVSSMFGVAAPANTPDEIIQKLNATLKIILSKSEVKDSLLAQGAIATYTTPQEGSKAVSDELAKWTKVVQEGNIKVE